MFRDYLMFITSYKIGEVHFRLLGTNGCHEMKDLMQRVRPVVTTSIMLISRRLGGLRRKTAGKSVPHVQHDYFSLFKQLNR